MTRAEAFAELREEMRTFLAGLSDEEAEAFLSDVKEDVALRKEYLRNLKRGEVPA